MNKPKFFECGICGHLHPAGFIGDCRDDSNRFTYQQLSDKYGGENDGFADDDGWQLIETDYTLNYADLTAEYRIGDQGDPWGTCMAWWFAVAAEMYERGLELPEEWQYRPSPLGARDPDAYETPICAAATDEALLKFGRVMNRLAGLLKRAGRSY